MVIDCWRVSVVVKFDECWKKKWCFGIFEFCSVKRWNASHAYNLYWGEREIALRASKVMLQACFGSIRLIQFESIDNKQSKLSCKQNRNSHNTMYVSVHRLVDMLLGNFVSKIFICYLVLHWRRKYQNENSVMLHWRSIFLWSQHISHYFSSFNRYFSTLLKAFHSRKPVELCTNYTKRIQSLILPKITFPPNLCLCKFGCFSIEREQNCNGPHQHSLHFRI